MANTAKQVEIPALEVEFQDPITREEYIRYRLKDQISYYERSSGRNKRKYQRIQVTQIILSAALPALVVFIEEETLHLKLLAQILGVVLAVLTGMQSLFGYQERWHAHRKTTEALKFEQFHYLARTGPYAGAVDPLAVLVERVENLVREDSSSWTQAGMEQKAAEVPTVSTAPGSLDGGKGL